MKERSGPVAIRYPRGGNGSYTGSAWNEKITPACVHREGKHLAIVTYGTLVNNAMEAARLLSEQGIEAMVMRLTCIHPLHADDLISQLTGINHVFVAEEIAGNSGIREHIACMLREHNSAITVGGIDLGNRYIQHGAVDKLYDYYGLSPEKLAKSIMEVHRSEN